MKKTLILLMLLIPLFAHAQKDNNSGNARLMLSDDPNRDPDWDWTVRMPGAGHQMFYYGPEFGFKQFFAQTPFRTQDDPFFVSDETKADMYKEDGWRLLYRDFGTPTSAPRMPFFILYNQYRGLMRVFVLNTTEPKSLFYEMRLMFPNLSPRTPMFAHADVNPANKFLDNYNGNDMLRYIGFAKPGGWFVGEFLLSGYDPDMPEKAVFRLEMREIDPTKILIKGTGNASGAPALTEILNNYGNLSGYAGYFENATLLNRGLKFLRPSAAENILSALAEGSNTSAVQPTEVQKTIGPTVEAIGKVLPNVTGFLGSNRYHHSRVPISFTLDEQELKRQEDNDAIQATMNLSGSVSSIYWFWSAHFAMSYSNTLTTTLYQPVSPHDWGLLNISSNIITNEIIDVDSSVQYQQLPEINCFYRCPPACGYRYDEYGNAFCGCEEEYVCEENKKAYPVYVTTYRIRFNVRHNPRAGLSLNSVRIVKSGFEYEMEINRISDDEVELVSPPIQRFVEDVSGKQGPNPNDANEISHLAVFFKVDEPGRNFPNDEIVSVQQVAFSEGKAKFKNEGGRSISSSDWNAIDLSEEETALSVAPNPLEAESEVRYFCQQYGPVQIQIVSLSGKILMEKRIHSRRGLNRVKLGASHETFSSGLYICRVVKANEVESTKLIINKS